MRQSIFLAISKAKLQTNICLIAEEVFIWKCVLGMSIFGTDFRFFNAADYRMNRSLQIAMDVHFRFLNTLLLTKIEDEWEMMERWLREKKRESEWREVDREKHTLG